MAYLPMTRSHTTRTVSAPTFPAQPGVNKPRTLSVPCQPRDPPDYSNDYLTPLSPDQPQDPPGLQDKPRDPPGLQDQSQDLPGLQDRPQDLPGLKDKPPKLPSRGGNGVFPREKLSPASQDTVPLLSSSVDSGVPQPRETVPHSRSFDATAPRSQSFGNKVPLSSSPGAAVPSSRSWSERVPHSRSFDATVPSSRETVPHSRESALYSRERVGQSGGTPPPPPALPAGGFRSPSSSASLPLEVFRPGEGQRHPSRADSGIEMDLTRGRLSSTSAANPRGSTIYECIDSSHQYTHPGSPASHSARSDEGPSGSSGGSCSVAGVYIPQDAPDANGRYLSLASPDPLEHTTATCHQCKRSPSPVRPLRCLCCGLVLLSIIVLLLAALVVYVFVVVIPGLQAHIAAQQTQMRMLASNHSSLTHRVESMVWRPPENLTSSAPDSDVLDSVLERIREINVSVQTVQSQLRDVSSDVHYHVNNVTHPSSVQGVSGTGSLNGCYYFNATSVVALPSPSSTTSWQPYGDQLRHYVVMSATCGVGGGTLHHVETRTSVSDSVQYRCRCDGHVGGHTRRACHIHLVLCPRVLPLDISMLP